MAHFITRLTIKPNYLTKESLTPNIRPEPR